MLGDVRQLVAALLTLSMLLMLTNTLFDSPAASSSSSVASPPPPPPPPSNAMHHFCWPRPTPTPTPPSGAGFITFSLTSAPPHHITQVTDAVLVASYLGATLVLPDIRAYQVGHTRNFEDLYDLHKFLSALTGIVQVAQDLPAHLATTQPALLRIKNRVSQYTIDKQIQPAFRTNNYLRLALISQSTNLKPKHWYPTTNLLATSCIAMFQTLELHPRLQQLGDTIIERLRELGAKSNAEFVAVDLRPNVLGSCILNGVVGIKNCYNATQVASFLKKVGFGEETVVYLTVASWHESLTPFKDSFPKSYTKVDIIPDEKKSEFLDPGNEDLAEVLDIYVCSKSDTFVAAVDGPFYSHVSGKRIASGRNRILVPPESAAMEWAQDSDFVSPFVSKKSHVAYSCYC